MHQNHDIFVRAVKNKRKVFLIFFSKTSNRHYVRDLVPVDYSPGDKTKGEPEHYRFLDHLMCSTGRLLTLSPNQITSIEKTIVPFDTKDLAISEETVIDNQL